jgi:hypothetical protein
MMRKTHKPKALYPYTRAEIVNGTGFARGVRFVEADNVYAVLGALLQEAYHGSDLRLSVRGREAISDAREAMALLDAGHYDAARGGA